MIQKRSRPRAAKAGGALDLIKSIGQYSIRNSGQFEEGPEAKTRQEGSKSIRAPNKNGWCPGEIVTIQVHVPKKGTLQISWKTQWPSKKDCELTYEQPLQVAQTRHRLCSRRKEGPWQQTSLQVTSKVKEMLSILENYFFSQQLRIIMLLSG